MIKTVIVKYNNAKNSIWLTNFIKRTTDKIKLLSVCHNLEEAEQAITESLPELVVIEGFEQSELESKLFNNKKNTSNSNIIFVTGYINKLAQHTISYSSSGPIDILKLERIVGILNNTDTNPYQLNNQNPDKINYGYIWIRDNINNWAPVNVQNIIYCSSDNQYTHLFITEPNKNKLKVLEQMGIKPNENGIIKWTSTKGIGEWDSILEYYGFCRIHNRTIVNLAHVYRYIKGKTHKVYMSNGKILNISKERRSKFLMLSGIK